MTKVELVVPGGSFEKFKFALAYGADAVYVGARGFSLRAKAKNFSLEELNEAVSLAKEKAKKVYLALNIFAHNHSLRELELFLKEVKNIPFDAFIVSDPGILCLVKEVIPESIIHLSTQANTTNFKSARFWESQGVRRVVLARELMLDEIKEIRDNTDVELETFVHGAMCVAYSGRCLLSKYFADRESNLGDCAHPCRWKYSVVEEKREGQFLPVLEGADGIEIFSSKDLCLIQYIDQLIECGINAFKIEGRMKSLFYVSNVTRVYREAIDAYYNSESQFIFKNDWLEELEKVSHRMYSTGFFFNKPNEEAQVKESIGIRKTQFLAIVTQVFNDGWCEVEVRSKIKRGDDVEIISPHRKSDSKEIISDMVTKDGEEIQEANPNQRINLKLTSSLSLFCILRK